jgi:sarcosine oxidase
MRRTYDAIVLGLGAVGSAAAYQLARRGSRTLGIDQFSPPHDQGSTHGDTRITRQAIGEGAHYTPLALRSYELFREVERETGADLLTTCGGLIISSDRVTTDTHVRGFFDNTLATARAYDIAHELLDASEIRRRFPQFLVRDDELAYYEPLAGFLRPEACVDAQLLLAGRHGAELHRGERALSYRRDGGSIELTTDQSTYSAERLVISAGPWLPALIDPPYRRLFAIRRQVLHWFDVGDATERFEPGRFPIFIWQFEGDRPGCYGFPAVDGPGGGIKIATEQYETTTTPDAVDRSVSVAETREMYERCVAPRLADVRSACIRSVTCLYTCTRDSGFVIDADPMDERVIIASPCSGHGFKHSAAVGEAIAELICDGRAHLDLNEFRLDRFAPR